MKGGFINLDSILSNPLYSRYPRIAPVAEIYGFKFEDIDTLMKIIESSRYREFITYPEINLRALLVRLNTHKDNFENKVAEVFFRSLDDMKELVGVQQIPLVYALYYKC